MTTAFSLRPNRLVRTLALWFGLAALMVQGLAPLCAGFMSGAPAGTASIVICTVHGSQIVQIGADGKALPAAPGKSLSDCCSTCHAPGSFTTPPPILAAVPADAVYMHIQIAVAPILGQRFYSSYLTRGPPPVNSYEFA